MGLFGRSVTVQLGTNNTTGTEHTGLRVSFVVKMSDASEPNEATIRIWNLTEQVVSTMQEDDAVIRLLVGYDSEGGAQHLIFEGDPISDGVKAELQGVDRILIVEAQDGGRAYTDSHIAEGFSTATSSGQLFQTIADAFGVTLGNVDGVVGDVDFPHGLSLTGQARELMDRVADLSGALWGIRDGALQVWEAGGTTGEEAVIFSAEAGNLIGSPSQTEDGVEVKALLAPTLRPGKPFRLESQSISGDYVATDVEFRGDSGFATEYYVIARGVPI